VPSILGWLPR